MGTITHSDTLYPHLLTMAGRERLVDEAYQVHDAVFSGMDRAAFRKMVLPESSTAASCCIAASTVRRWAIAPSTCSSAARRARSQVLRGQAGLLKDYRGRNSNMPFLAGCMLRYWLRGPWRPMYFLGAMIHPSSFIQMHKYAAGMWPSPEGDGAAAGAAGGGVVWQFRHGGASGGAPLRGEAGHFDSGQPDRSPISAAAPRPAARYFVEHNPDYHEGHGLLAMAELSPTAILNGVWRYLRDRRSAAAERSRALGRLACRH